MKRSRGDEEDEDAAPRVLRDCIRGEPRPAANAASLLLDVLFPDRVEDGAYAEVDDVHSIYVPVPRATERRTISSVLRVARGCAPNVSIVYKIEPRPRFVVLAQETPRPVARVPSVAIDGLELPKDFPVTDRAVLETAGFALLALAQTEGRRYDDFRVDVASREYRGSKAVELRYARVEGVAPHVHFSALSQFLPPPASSPVLIDVIVEFHSLAFLFSAGRRIA